MGSFKLVVLDYPKNNLNNLNNAKVLNDLIIQKQINFERTDSRYVVLDKHDMIGTHYLIYENSDIFNPKLIFALRTTFEDRAKYHKINTPLLDLIPQLDEKCQNAFYKFREIHPVIADCNSWFVHPDYSKKNSGLNMSDIGYGMVYLHIRRMGFNHIAGCTNERYKASRWLENIGEFNKGYTFIHPTVPDEHLMILVERFKKDYLRQVFETNRALFENLLEINPHPERSLQDVIKEEFESPVVPQMIDVAS